MMNDLVIVPKSLIKIETLEKSFLIYVEYEKEYSNKLRDCVPKFVVSADIYSKSWVLQNYYNAMRNYEHSKKKEMLRKPSLPSCWDERKNIHKLMAQKQLVMADINSQYNDMYESFSNSSINNLHPRALPIIFERINHQHYRPNMIVIYRQFDGLGIAEEFFAWELRESAISYIEQKGAEFFEVDKKDFEIVLSFLKKRSNYDPDALPYSDYIDALTKRLLSTDLEGAFSNETTQDLIDRRKKRLKLRKVD